MLLNKKFKLLCVVALVLITSSCAHHFQQEDFADPYGFFAGIWHGLIVVFSFIGWIFLDDVYIIGEPNTGLMYYIGFALGIMCFFSNR